jgi:hypothetical protein
MKKLGKLAINPEKLMTDGELVTLKGGYDLDCGGGSQTVYCLLSACEGCTLTYDPVCVPEGTQYPSEYVAEALFAAFGIHYVLVICNE